MDTLALCLGGGLVVAALAHAIIGVRAARYSEAQKERARSEVNREFRAIW